MRDPTGKVVQFVVILPALVDWRFGWRWAARLLLVFYGFLYLFPSRRHSLQSIAGRVFTSTFLLAFSGLVVCWLANLRIAGVSLFARSSIAWAGALPIPSFITLLACHFCSSSFTSSTWQTFGTARLVCLEPLFPSFHTSHSAACSIVFSVEDFN